MEEEGGFVRELLIVYYRVLENIDTWADWLSSNQQFLNGLLTICVVMLAIVVAIQNGRLRSLARRVASTPALNRLDERVRSAPPPLEASARRTTNLAGVDGALAELSRKLARLETVSRETNKDIVRLDGAMKSLRTEIKAIGDSLSHQMAIQNAVSPSVARGVAPVSAPQALGHTDPQSRGQVASAPSSLLPIAAFHDELIAVKKRVEELQHLVASHHRALQNVSDAFASMPPWQELRPDVLQYLSVISAADSNPPARP